MEMKRPLFSKPLGPSELGEYADIFWNNCGWGTDGPILCEICGTTHPEKREESYIMSRFLGLQVVEECCGAILDIVYRESGPVFASKLLQELADNPAAFKYKIFLDSIREAMEKAAKKLAETGIAVAEISAAVEKL